MKGVPEKSPAAGSRTGSPRTETAPARTEATPAPTPGPAATPDRRSLQGLQRAAGNAAVSRLVAQRYTAPVKPSPAQAPGFRGVKADIAAKKQRLAQHRPAATESKASQDAAVAPPDDKEAQGKAANAEKMNAAKPGEFDKKAFIDAVNKAIDAQAPKNLDDADKFSKSGKAERVKAEVDGKVSDGKEASSKDIDTATKAPPDTSAAKDKPVTPLTPDQPPGNPGAPSAAAAIPEKQPASVTDFSEGPAQNDKAMADAEVTEDQLAKGNEPEFNEALSAKKTAEADSAKAPAKGRSAESRQLSAAKAGAAASGAAAMSTLTATRAQAGQKVDGGKGETKSKDEKKRAEVTAKLQKVYDGTKKDVEATLSGLDKKVDAAFTSGEKAARDAFTADHKRRMKQYKDKRYSGWTGKARWVKDKFAGLPEEANNLYQEARKLYVSRMQTVISSVADIIGTELGRAKARIAKGRGELKAEVDKLPADLKQFGEEAAKDFAGKFDDLEASVNEKSEQLVQDLAQKYTAALNKVDEEIKKLQEANKGLIDKAKDAIVGAIKTINELKNLLLGILAKAAGAIMKIIKDPIGFLGNLVSAVGAGLNLFLTNIADHLKTGVVSWLLGTAVKAGLELPQKFDMKGIIQLIGSLLGLTWANIRARVTRKGVPDQAMTAVESSVPVAQNIAREGPAGAVKEIQEEAGDLKSTILEKLTSYLIPTVIIAGITWILSLLNPASAFVRAVKGIIDIVTFVVNQGAQIVEFVNSVLDAVVAIANGGKAGVPKMVETALAASVPLLIGFLASLLGIGSLAAKVKSVFHAVSHPVNRAIDKIVNFITKKGKALWNKLKGKAPGRDDSPQGKQKRLDKGLDAAVAALNRFSDRPVGRRALTPVLAGIRARYSMKSLEPVEDGERWSVRGKVNPTSTRGTRAPRPMTEEEALKKVQESLPDAAEKYAKSAHDEWWRLYITKVKVQTSGGESSPLWARNDIDSTTQGAYQLTETTDFQKALTSYFTSNEFKKSGNFHWYTFRRIGSPAKKKFLEKLGPPVPEELKNKGLTKVRQVDPGGTNNAGLVEQLNELGSHSYQQDIGPYGRLDLPSAGKSEHTNYYPERIHLDGNSERRITTYTTRAGKQFRITETDPSRDTQLKVEGFDLQLKPEGDPRGVTQNSPGYIGGEDFNRSHAVADIFGGSGYRDGLNIVTTSDTYNQVTMRAAERRIETEVAVFAGDPARVGEVSLDLTVTITFGELLKDYFENKIRSLPDFQSGDAAAEKELSDMIKSMFKEPARRVMETEYEWKISGPMGAPSGPRKTTIGPDDFLFLKREVTSNGS
ncbi:HPC2 multi-domain protein [Streptomyces sp. NPDC056010]|uniref:HPC2 multi-domain protein n=1 Tax=Streptomyces sp. NPDC056010 TaxID=3345679 RepID=UPI0035D6EC1F